MNIERRLQRLEDQIGAGWCDHDDGGLLTSRCSAADLLAGRVDEVPGDVPACRRCGLAPNATVVTEVLVTSRAQAAALREAGVWA